MAPAEIILPLPAPQILFVARVSQELVFAVFLLHPTHPCTTLSLLSLLMNETLLYFPAATTTQKNEEQKNQCQWIHIGQDRETIKEWIGPISPVAIPATLQKGVMWWVRPAVKMKVDDAKEGTMIKKTDVKMLLDQLVLVIVISFSYLDVACISSLTWLVSVVESCGMEGRWTASSVCQELHFLTW